MSDQVEALQFQNKAGITLDAKLNLPDSKPVAYAILAHCFACSKDLIAEARIAQALTLQGIAVLRFDFTGLGKSGGDFSDTNFSSNVGDIVSAAACLAEHYEAPKLLIGHSLGGTAILAAAGKIDSAQAVATIAAPSDPAHIIHQFGEHVDEIKEKGETQVSLGGRPFVIKKQFLDDVERNNVLKAVAEFQKPLLIFHSPIDAVVSIEEARVIYETAKHPKSFISLDQANHLLTKKEDAIYVARVLSAWASRYVGDIESHDVKQEHEEKDWVLVRESGKGKFTQDIKIGHHTYFADEPKSVGGNEWGPSPYEWLLAGLGACTAMTLRLYADRKKLPLERVLVKLKHEKVHAEDCGGCESNNEKLDVIERKIILEGSLDAASRKALLAIANKCPVHKTLAEKVEIKTEVE